MSLWSLAAVLLALLWAVAGRVDQHGSLCRVLPEGDGQDDSPSIIEAFDKCGQDGSIAFESGAPFSVQQVMNTTNLTNCDVDFSGARLVFSTDVAYWLQHSLDVVFQNQSTAWLIGGHNLTIRGGIYDGNGQVWYDENQNQSNQPGRPISMTIYNSTDVVVDGLTFDQPQFWALFVSYSRNVTLSNMAVSAVSKSQWRTVNSDGLDTWNSDQVLVTNWTVTNGDDCIAAKGNTTNLHVRNVTCHGGNGMTIGSVGQYPETPDFVENVLFENITVTDAINAAFIKTWQGVPVDNSTNGDGGGGGSGYIKNITFADFIINEVALPIQITQCIYSERKGRKKDCESSKMAILDVAWRNVRGTTKYNIAASLHCAASHPCPGVRFEDVELVSVNQSIGLPNYGVERQDEIIQCANLVDAAGIPCNKYAPADFGQFVGGNVPFDYDDHQENTATLSTVLFKAQRLGRTRQR
ncbi:putative exopolygalacturonase precursor [Acaromyces ingoldii]|uniref:Putative exopolygalacturonase n=1 Tax=Acaromyces ingoldii TaxID=215250 RepID=A0A316YFK7_9BASI|nr:putative exopolygalacturonase precursor [Acaromyces ingoldii]PWN87866.1 putative exopolygalacturonase precursor [Acaromyces ingoldii]